MSPVIFLLALGTADFGRALYHAITVANAAGTGASYGSQNTVAAGDFQEMEQRAANDAQNLEGVSTAADQICMCPDGAQVACSNLAVTSCSGYGVPRAYVRVRVQEEFGTVRAFPGVPSRIQLNQRAWMRVR